MAEIVNRERLPDWNGEIFERYRMNQLTQILERRLLGLESAITDILLENAGLIGGDAFAPIVHTHGISEITDFPIDNVTLDANDGHISIRDDVILGDLSDVDLSGLQPNNVIKWTGTAWEPDDFAQAGNSFASLTDTTISASPIDGAMITFDLVSSRWVDTDADTLPFVQVAGDTMEGTLRMNENLITFGTTEEARIFHSGSELIFRSSSADAIRIQVNGTETGILINPNGSVQEFYDDVLTTATTILGFDIFGTLLDVDTGADSDIESRIRNSIGGLTTRVDSSTGLARWIQTTSGGAIEQEFMTAARDGAWTAFNNGVATARTGVSTFEVWDGDSWEDVVLDTRTLDINGDANEIIVDLAGPLDLSADRAWAIGIADNPIFPGDASMEIPTGTTAQEPAGADGQMRFDTDTDRYMLFAQAEWDELQHISGSPQGLGPYTYEATITEPPATGELRFNNLTIGSATSMFVHDTNAQSVDVSNFLALFGAGAIFYIAETTDSSRWVLVEVSTATDDTTHWQFDIQAIDVGNALRDGNPISIFGSLAGGGGGGALNDLSDVDITGVATGDILYKSAGDWLDTTAIFIDPAGEVRAQFNAADVFRTKVDGFDVIGDVNSTDLRFYEIDGTTLGATLRFNSANDDFTIRNEKEDQPVFIQGTSSGLKTMMRADPQAGVLFTFDGITKFVTAIDGALITGELLDVNLSASTIASQIRVRQNEGGVSLWTDDGDSRLYQISSTGALEDIILQKIEDGALTLYDTNDVLVLQTTTLANGGVEVDQGDGLIQVGAYHLDAVTTSTQDFSTTTLVDVTGFTTDISTGETYIIECDLFLNQAGGAADIRSRLDYSGTVNWSEGSYYGRDSGTATFLGDRHLVDVTVTAIPAGTAGDESLVKIRATLNTTGASGTLKLQLGQSSSDLQAVTLERGSTMQVRRIPA